MRAVFSGLLVAIFIVAWSGANPASAADSSRTNLQGIPGLAFKSRAHLVSPPGAIGAKLTANPTVTDVGDQVILTLTATRFTPGSSATVRFLSPHHGFSGAMPWDARCACFRLAIYLAKRSHALELSRASATVVAGKASTVAYTTFQIRGLTADGRSYVPGGATIFTAWVGDPSPVATEFQHYCVWARTVDSLGVPGMTVKLSVHFKKHTENWTAGTTGPSGVLCTRRSIGHPQIGFAIRVDAYANGLHAETSFTPRG